MQENTADVLNSSALVSTPGSQELNHISKNIIFTVNIKKYYKKNIFKHLIFSTFHPSSGTRSCQQNYEFNI